MDAAAVCTMLYRTGVTLSARDGRLVASPASKLTDEMRELIRQHKLDLVDFIRASEVAAGELIEAAMRACDHHGDGDHAREQMRRDCLATPPHLQADLLAHFRQNYERVPGKRPT